MEHKHVFPLHGPGCAARAGRSLRTRRSNTVALLVSDIANPWFGQIASLVEQNLHRHGYSLMLCNSGEDTEREGAYLELLAERRVDGVVIASSPNAPQDAYVFDPTGHLLRTPHLPQFGRDGEGFLGTLSRDGRSLGFVANDLSGFSAGPHAGVVDLTTGQVTNLCDAGCWYLLVR